MNQASMNYHSMAQTYQVMFTSIALKLNRLLKMEYNILSSSALSNNTSENKIMIIPTTEQPPPAPGEQKSAITSQIPAQYILEQNYPNPFNPATTINYTLPDVNLNGNPTYNVTLKIYNIVEEEAATLVNEIQDAGYKSVKFDASRLPSGIYTYRLTAGTSTEVKKMLLMK